MRPPPPGFTPAYFTFLGGCRMGKEEVTRKTLIFMCSHWKYKTENGKFNHFSTFDKYLDKQIPKILKLEELLENYYGHLFLPVWRQD